MDKVSEKFTNQCRKYGNKTRLLTNDIHIKELYLMSSESQYHQGRYLLPRTCINYY